MSRWVWNQSGIIHTLFFKEALFLHQLNKFWEAGLYFSCTFSTSRFRRFASKHSFTRFSSNTPNIFKELICACDRVRTHDLSSCPMFNDRI